MEPATRTATVNAPSRSQTVPLHRTSIRRERALFGGTFLLAWLALDRLISSPPTAVSATAALFAAASIVVLSEVLRSGGSPRTIARRVGLTRPRRRSLVAAAVVGGAFIATYLTGAAMLGIELELRTNWPTVLVGVLVFHGIAEELVWRGYAFGFLRRRHPFWRAIGWSVPLIAVTHVPIIATAGVAAGTLAVISAAATCLPFAYLWERSGHTIWAPAILHAAVGTWQLYQRSYGIRFQVLILTASILVPFAAFLFRDRFFDVNGSSPIDHTTNHRKETS